MSERQNFNGGEYVDKARDAARDHPDQARSAIDKVQEAVNQKTGGKFGSIIDKAGDFVEDKLGLPEEKKAEPKGDSTPSEDKTSQPKGEGSAPSEPKTEPTSGPKSEPTTEPTAQDKPAGDTGSTGGGVLPD